MTTWRPVHLSLVGPGSAPSARELCSILRAFWVGQSLRERPYATS